ncbi:proline-rich receptor-like protein kinase PERK10 [Humulus lupulus]|uniref:proline-rich receptor-like protein kinase PERK10 n=1 Tax=Humulus lupulus TaxID=3486 RepID=UPI002B4165FE|nr:proline-rich receptor-like protein kinase PERK10 [Humulus lupulus]
MLVDEDQPSLLITDIPFSRTPPSRPHSNPSTMGRVKSTAQKKKTQKPSANQPAPQAEIPSTSGRAESTPEPGIQAYAQLRRATRPDVEWYVAPPSRIMIRMIANYIKKYGLPGVTLDVRESIAGSATGTKVPEQQPDVSQPPPRRATGVTINEPTGAPRPTTALAPPGKGKKKATEPILDYSDENDMPAERAFDLYTKSASKKKSHRRQSVEGCSNQPAKKPRTDDPPASTPTKETTPPPAPTRETTPSTPTNPDPLSPVGQTPPPAPVDPMPPTSTVQQSVGH